MYASMLTIQNFNNIKKTKQKKNNTKMSKNS